jgi:LacI family transcriptional regulator
MARRVTVRDVAAAAGVSISTASRALSQNPSVNPDMARRVIKKSTELGYTANVFARALRTQRTDTIGMVVPSISNPYFVGVVEAVEKVLAGHGRSLILCDARDSVETEGQRIEVLVQRMVDGLIVIPVTEFESVPAIEVASAQGPVVLFDRWADAARTDFVGTDNEDGLRQSVNHLRAVGATSIVYIGAEPHTSTAQERLRTFQDLVPGGAATALLGSFTAEWGEQAALELLKRGPLPDAIVCGADIIAVSLLSALRNAGVPVPGAVKIVSFDGTLLSRLTVPRLTSVSQPIDAMAAEAVRLLDARSASPDHPVSKSIFSPTLIVNGSTQGWAPPTRGWFPTGRPGSGGPWVNPVSGSRPR